MKWNWVVYQQIVPEHTAYAASEYKGILLNWPSQSPEQNRINLIWLIHFLINPLQVIHNYIF